MPIIYDDWKDITMMQTDDPPSEPDGFLRIRRGDVLHIIHEMVDIGRTESPGALAASSDV